MVSDKSALEPLHRFPRMMQEWLVAQVREVERLGDLRRAALHSKDDAQKYVQSARERIRQSFGPEPEKTPLNARITGVLERETYRVEKVIFESRPGFLVTANLYVPKGRKFPLPGVVGSCGHSVNGKAADTYQSFAQGLARMGYVVLIFDPVGQGERFQFVTEKPGKGLVSSLGGGVGEHLQMGNPQALVGEFLGAWRAWDGVRALDYLLSRAEVDKKHVGITGNSGGGTMTTWLCGVESRWTMAAPGCFVTTFRHNAENELPTDTEQCPPRVLALGLDHSDFLAAMAPKPVIILAKEKDFFDVRGAEETFARMQRLYALLDAPQNIQLQVGPTPHGYTQENREAMYRFFNNVTKISDAQTEPELVMEKDEDLWCAPKGQVSELKSRTLMSFTKDLAQDFAKRPRLSGTVLSDQVGSLLRVAVTLEAPSYRILRIGSNRGYPAKWNTTYVLDTEPGIQVPVTRIGGEAMLSRPPRGKGRAVLYVSHRSADTELRSEPLVTEIVQQERGVPFHACDVRGIGESEPNTCGNNEFLKPYGSDYFYASHGLMLDRPMLGQRTHDVMQVLNWLVANGHEEVHLVGMGWGALPATFAALLHPNVKQVTLKHALESFSVIAETPDQKWPAAMMPYEVLRHFDLPECYEALKARQLRSIEPWSAGDGMNAA